ncbi:hypothetical protein SAMN05421877_103216 [Sphingobacterium lactis]|uniref:Uncharacterized protein n=1 Tax=Sphingobacterium lactis TaxID=797291 RepID=A0A1H5VRY3_9SPHI|nr:hypothetical protein SAMN05421877_103216 [Sphingobacterium lactis]
MTVSKMANYMPLAKLPQLYDEFPNGIGDAGKIR